LVFFVIYFGLYVLWSLVNLISKKYNVFILHSLVTVLFIGVFFVGSHYIDMVYNELGNIGETKKIDYMSYLITLSDKEFKEGATLGRISDKDDIEGYKLAEKLYIKEKLTNTIQDYDDYILMLKELYAGKVDAIFVPSTYVILFSNEEGLENLQSDTKIIYEYKETLDNQDMVNASDKDFNIPLTFLVMGVDSEKNGLNANAAFNGDTLMLVSFNPDTLKTTMVSLPRDTYVPIACRNNSYAKINSAAAYGTSCVIDTVSNFLDVDIDYYAKINFKGVVELVDAVGGVSVDVEAPDFKHHNALGINCNGKFCEQNSNRETGKNDIIYLDPGVQKLNGEEALAYARCRYMYAGGDLDRIKHQQQVVEALAKELLSFESISDFQKILSAVSNNMVTNMDRAKILSGYNVIKKMFSNAFNGEDMITINKAHLETYGLYMYIPAQKSNSSVQGYYKDSLEDIMYALKQTLGIEKEEEIKTFDFSINEEYVANSPGAGLKKNPSASLLKNFVGKTVGEAEEYCKTHGINFNISYVDPGDEHYNPNVQVGLIGRQSVHENVLLSTVSELTVYVVNSVQSSKPSEEEKPNGDIGQNEETKPDDKGNVTDSNNDGIDDIIDSIIR